MTRPLDRRQVQRAARAADEAGAVEEDAGPIDYAGVGAGAIAKDAVLACLGVALEAGGVQGGRKSGDHPGFVFVAQVGSDGAASETEMLRRLGTDALATSTPKAHPPRGQEVPVEAPDRVTVADFLHRRAHPTSLLRSTRSLASTPPGSHSHLDTPLLLASLPETMRHKTVVVAGADYFFDKRWKAITSSFAFRCGPHRAHADQPKGHRPGRQHAGRRVERGFL